MPNIAIIPARGGSKRIPKKNIKSFLGKPIIAYSVEAALKSGLFDVVMVSTDDHEIARIAKEYGAEVPFLRGQANSSDFATTYDVIEEVLNAYANKGKQFENCCCIYPTAPFVNAALLNNTYEKLNGSLFDVVYPVLEYSYPIWRSVKLSGDNKASFIWPENALKRSQDLEKAYHDAGQFYWFKTQAVITSKKLISDNAGVVVLDELDAHDIDNQTDWEVAEFKFRFKNSN